MRDESQRQSSKVKLPRVRPWHYEYRNMSMSRFGVESVFMSRD